MDIFEASINWAKRIFLTLGVRKADKFKNMKWPNYSLTPCIPCTTSGIFRLLNVKDFPDSNYSKIFHCLPCTLL